MWRLLKSSSLILVLALCLISLANCQLSEEEGKTRAKRSYYGGYDMYGLAPIAPPPPPPPPPPPASMPIQYPMNYDTPGNANYNPVTAIRQPRQIHVESSPRDSETSGGQVIFSGEDRYYTSSTAPAPVYRPDGFNVSRY
uniref:Uncharacterized protein n=1 Tax=Caenorhabditis japonica TaxID=281687 RepID=A0A8R1HG05_CAEJA